MSGLPDRSDAPALAGDLGLRHLLRDHPGVERVADAVSAGAVPTLRREDLDIDLLPGGQIDVSVLVEVSVVAHGRDVIMARRNVAIERTAVCDRPEIAAIHVDIRQIE